MPLSVGNIPWETTEAQLLAHCNSAGRVTHMRLVLDHVTGKAKGYAFCEFSDHHTAAAAIRNLNAAEFNGRALRVDFSDPAHRSTAADSNVNRRGGGGGGGGASYSSSSSGMGGGHNQEELRRIFGSSQQSGGAAAASSSVAPAVHMSQPSPPVQMDTRMADVPQPQQQQQAPPKPVVYESTIGAQAPAVPPVAQPYVSAPYVCVWVRCEKGVRSASCSIRALLGC